MPRPFFPHKVVLYFKLSLVSASGALRDGVSVSRLSHLEPLGGGRESLAQWEEEFSRLVPD